MVQGRMHIPGIPEFNLSWGWGGMACIAYHTTQLQVQRENSAGEHHVG